jgi:hypothetical protein
MATVTLDRAFLALAADPADTLSFFTTSRTDQRQKPGEVRRYANGRLRIVTRPGKSTALGVTAVSLTPAQVAKLDDWSGRLVLFRDAWGRKFYCTFFVANVVDFPDRTHHDVEMSLSQVTFRESV